jgi:hypothetical protein
MHNGQSFSLPNGMLIPVFNRLYIILGYTIIDLSKTLTDIYFQIEREIVDLDTTIWLNGKNWTIYISKMYKSLKTPGQDGISINLIQNTMLLT